MNINLKFKPMYINIEIVVANVGTFKPKGFYYKGAGSKTKLVIIGCEIENHYKRQIFPLSQCTLLLKRYNKFGDDFTI